MSSKKTRKLRGSRTHGWGAGKKHRGAGHRGGRGNAGSGKRGQQKVSYYLSKGLKAIGHGRKIKSQSKSKILNVGELAKRLKSWEAKGLIKKDKNLLVIDLTKLGYDKLLGVGEAKELKGKVKIIVDKMSALAKDKLGIKEETPKEKGEKQ